MEFLAGRGVAGLFVLRGAIVITGRGIEGVPGGVGGLPVEGFKWDSVDLVKFSRGFRNIVFYNCAVPGV